MGDVLSQSEIDNLLKAISEGGGESIRADAPASKKEAKKYDFKMPSKFSKEQLRTLEIIFDNYARLVSSFLSAYLRTTIVISVADASQTNYGEFSNSLINPEILAILSPSPLKGSIILEISPGIGYAMIDRILGGPGFGLKKMRDFSEIEKVLLERVISQMILYLEEPWENVVVFRPRLEKIETNPQFAQIVSPAEIVALITLNIKIGATEGFMNFCLPNPTLEPVVEKLNTKYWFNTPAEENLELYQEKIEVQLEKAMIPVSAVIGYTNITVNDFINLQVGDIIPLDSYIGSDISIKVGNLLKFHGKPGLNRGKYAVQITQVVGEEQ
ncbi:MAG: flagellar motor switch protein FliM [Clostridiales bacterium]|jgi:flagellar motor switch protein FliM|nr:flagellar motor switch protein FliM [Clostridiales bacterium]